MERHFGVRVREREGGQKLTENNFITESHKSGLYPGTIIPNDEYEHYREDAKVNLEYNLKYFSKLDSTEFNQSIIEFCQKTGFVEITDLSLYNEKSGYYLMVMDEYCQFYLGCCDNLKKRIMRHWSQVVPIDRLVFWSPETSKLSIDSFRAFDTSRIFILLTDDLFSKEDYYINMLPDKFLINRNKGGKLNKNEVFKDIKMRNFDLI